MPYISSLHVYPIKSCAGHDLSRAELDVRGIHNDRSWMVVTESGSFLSQRTHPAMTRIQTALDNGHLSVSAPEMDDLTLETKNEGDTRQVDIWGDLCDGVDQGDAAAAWFSTYLNTSCRLVHFKTDFVRPVDPDYAPRTTDQVGFADGFPLLLISVASLADLNVRLPEPIRMNRFRPNIVVADCPPYSEDTWKQIRVGDLLLDVVKPCGRCATTLVEQESGSKGKEPLKTLATYRKLAGPDPVFGQNVVHQSEGVLETGMVVEIIY